MQKINQVLSGGIVPLLLLITGIAFFCLFGWRILAAPRRAAQAMLGREKKSALRALAVALAGTLGVGNIAGVAAAIVLGGAGAVFWMWVSALLAMLLKYAEILLALQNRHYDKAGRAHGGAMYYIKKYIGGRTGRFLAVLFALFCLACTFMLGGVIQSNAAAVAMEQALGVPRVWVGGLLGLSTAVILACGTRRVEDACTLIVPFVCLLFGVASVAVLVLRREAIPNAFAAIFKGAFSLQSGASGVLGFFTSRALRYGVARGLISNEAGCGTAPIAHAAAGTKKPAAQGVWGIVEVFVDTVLLCTVTALVLLVSGQPLTGDGMALALDAYGAVLGGIAPPVLALSVLLFAFATLLCWSHYGAECLYYLTGRSSTARWLALPIALAALLGALFAAEVLWELTDIVIALMAIINISALWAGRQDVAQETRQLLQKK